MRGRRGQSGNHYISGVISIVISISIKIVISIIMSLMGGCANRRQSSLVPACYTLWNIPSIAC
jgi:hypothetical protein